MKSYKEIELSTQTRRRRLILDNIKDLNRRIHNQDDKCGNCIFWFTESCPKQNETNDGYETYPNYKTEKCDKYEENDDSKKFRLELKKELANLINR